MRVAILLAAGGSRRFGRQDKLLARLHGRAILLHALDRALESANRVIVVVPSFGGRVGRVVPNMPRIHRIVARRHREGLAASLAAGLRALRPIDREVLVFLGDMPFAVGSRLRLRPGWDAVRPSGATPGHPVLLRTNLLRRIELQGDKGFGSGLARLGLVRACPGNMLDIDTAAALRRARHKPLVRALYGTNRPPVPLSRG